jgi:hypothetical protein
MWNGLLKSDSVTSFGLFKPSPVSLTSRHITCDMYWRTNLFFLRSLFERPFYFLVFCLFVFSFTVCCTCYMFKLIVYTETTELVYINHVLCFVTEVTTYFQSLRYFFHPIDVELSPQITNTEPAHLYKAAKNWRKHSLSLAALFIAFLEARDRWVWSTCLWIVKQMNDGNNPMRNCTQF